MVIDNGVLIGIAIEYLKKTIAMNKQKEVSVFKVRLFWLMYFA